MRNNMKTFLAAPGIQFEFIDPDNSTLRETLPGNSYEPAVAHLMLRYIKPSDVVLDIGALYGYFSCLAAKVSTDIKVYAFDPCIEYCSVIDKNAKLNGLKNLYSVPIALSDTNSEWHFKEKTLIAGTRGKSSDVPLMAGPQVNNVVSNHSMQETELHSTVSFWSWLSATSTYIFKKILTPPQEVIVNSIRYDDWAKQNNVVATIAKIDVHGAEVVVLRGMKEALLSDIQHVILEVHRIDMLVDGDYCVLRPS